MAAGWLCLPKERVSDKELLADWPVLERSVIPRFCNIDVEYFSHTEVDAPSLPELSVKSEGAVGLTDLAVSSNCEYA